MEEMKRVLVFPTGERLEMREHPIPRKEDYITIDELIYKVNLVCFDYDAKEIRIVLAQY
jgi:hypothetical protein